MLIAIAGAVAVPPRGAELSDARLVVLFVCVLAFGYVAYILWDTATTAEGFSVAENDGDAGPSSCARKDAPVGAVGATICAICAILASTGDAGWWPIIAGGLGWIAISIFFNTATNAFVVWRVGEGSVRDAPLPWPSAPPRSALAAYVGTSILAIVLEWIAKAYAHLGDAALVALIVCGLVCAAFEGLWPGEKVAATGPSIVRRLAPWLTWLAFVSSMFRIGGATQLGQAMLAGLFSGAVFVLLVPAEGAEPAFGLKFRIAAVSSALLATTAIGLFLGSAWMPQLTAAFGMVGAAAAVGLARLRAPWQTVYDGRQNWSEARTDAYIAADAHVRRYRPVLLLTGYVAYMLWIGRRFPAVRIPCNVALAVLAVPLVAYAIIVPIYLMKVVCAGRGPILPQALTE